MTTSQTAVFRQIVGDHMSLPPIAVPAGMPAAAEAVGRMAEAEASAVVVVDTRRGILGILTEQDAVRRVTRSAPDAPVDAAMTSPVLTVRADDHLYEAIGFMRRHRLRHMPVVDGDGAPVGLLHLHDALAVAAGPMVEDIDRLTHEDSLAGLAEVKAAQVRLAEHLLADHVPAPEVQALVSDINNDVHGRVLRLCVAAMGEEGRVPPPVPFACIVMGSGGRGESLLSPDQDNGFVLAAYPDDLHPAVDAWFVELAERMTQALDRSGLPLCRGGVMATNPAWRKTLPRWRRRWQAGCARAPGRRSSAATSSSTSAASTALASSRRSGAPSSPTRPGATGRSWSRCSASRRTTGPASACSAGCKWNATVLCGVRGRGCTSLGQRRLAIA